MDHFLYDRDLLHERAKRSLFLKTLVFISKIVSSKFQNNCSWLVIFFLELDQCMLSISFAGNTEPLTSSVFSPLASVIPCT